MNTRRASDSARSAQHVLEDEGAEVCLLDTGAAPQAMVDQEGLELRDGPLRELVRVREGHLCTNPPRQSSAVMIHDS